MFSKTSFNLLVVSNTTPFFTVVQIIYFHDCIYKSFIRPHLDYGDIIYDIPGNESFSQKIESVQYNAALAITGCFLVHRERRYILNSALKVFLTDDTAENFSFSTK